MAGSADVGQVGNQRPIEGADAESGREFSGSPLAALSNAILRRYGFPMPPDLAAISDRGTDEVPRENGHASATASGIPIDATIGPVGSYTGGGPG